MNRSNYHTHSTYCDGKNTLRETVEKAVELGCQEVGFSGHCYMETGEEHPWWMTVEDTEKYKAEIRELKNEYKGKIEILLGTERDYFFADKTTDYEYVIGSVHYLLKDGVYLPIDESRETQISAVNEFYNGDFYSYIEDYFALVGDVANKTDCDVVGHFDLVTKFNEDGALFDTSNERYISAADSALEKLMGRGLYFEINYGAIPRGYRKTPYPEPRIIEKLKANGEKILYTSDCHDNNYLLYGIEDNIEFIPKKRK